MSAVMWARRSNVRAFASANPIAPPAKASGIKMLIRSLRSTRAIDSAMKTSKAACSRTVPQPSIGEERVATCMGRVTADRPAAALTMTILSVEGDVPCRATVRRGCHQGRRNLIAVANNMNGDVGNLERIDDRLNQRRRTKRRRIDQDHGCFDTSPGQLAEGCNPGQIGR